jgi:hypothetical protein
MVPRPPLTAFDFRLPTSTFDFRPSTFDLPTFDLDLRPRPRPFDLRPSTSTFDLRPSTFDLSTFDLDLDLRPSTFDSTFDLRPSTSTFRTFDLTTFEPSTPTTAGRRSQTERYSTNPRRYNARTPSFRTGNELGPRFCRRTNSAICPRLGGATGRYSRPESCVEAPA